MQGLAREGRVLQHRDAQHTVEGARREGQRFHAGPGIDLAVVPVAFADAQVDGAVLMAGARDVGPVLRFARARVQHQRIRRELARKIRGRH